MHGKGVTFPPSDQEGFLLPITLYWRSPRQRFLLVAPLYLQRLLPSLQAPCVKKESKVRRVIREAEDKTFLTVFEESCLNCFHGTALTTTMMTRRRTKTRRKLRTRLQTHPWNFPTLNVTTLI